MEIIPIIQIQEKTDLVHWCEDLAYQWDQTIKHLVAIELKRQPLRSLMINMHKMIDEITVFI